VADVLCLLPEEACPFGAPIERVQRHGRSGQTQHDTDILIYLKQGTLAGVECKCRPNWSAAHTRTLFQKPAILPLSRRLLVLSRSIDAGIQSIEREFADSGWIVWFEEDLRRVIQRYLRNDRGAWLLAEWFGESVARQLLDLETSCYLIRHTGAFRGLLNPQRYFHHARPALGLTSARRTLDRFVRNNQHLVLPIYAAGGVGKTKFLYRLGQRFERRHQDVELRYWSGANRFPDDLASQLTRLPKGKRCVLVVDDVHRLTGNLESLLAEARKAEGRLKVVLAGRPQGSNAVDTAVNRSGLDVSQVAPRLHLIAPDELHLTSWTKLRLPHDLREHAYDLVRIAQGSWLLLTVSLEILKRDKTFPRYKHAAVRQEILRRFEDEVLGHLRDDLPEERVRDALRLLSALSPMPDQNEAKERAASWLKCERHELEEILFALLDAGILHEENEGFRVLPDLLADHILYQKCKTSPSYASALCAAFGDFHCRALVRNLAEAEHLAREENLPHHAFTRPLLEKHLQAWPNMRFSSRKGIAEMWTKVAIYVPEAILEITRAAIEHPEQPDAQLRDEEEEVFEKMGLHSSNQADVMQSLLAALRDVALAVPTHREQALERLWEIGVRFPKLASGAAEWAFEKLAEALSYDGWQENGMDSDVVCQSAVWLARKLTPPVSELPKDRVASLGELLLQPWYEVQRNRSRQTQVDRVMAWSEVVKLPETETARECITNCALTWCRQNEPQVALAGAKVLTAGHRAIFEIGPGHGTKAQQRQWLLERRKLLEHVQSTWAEFHPLAAWWFQKDLRRRVSRADGRDPIQLNRLACLLLDEIETNDEVRWHRLFLSTYEDEFPIRWQQVEGDDSTPLDLSQNKWLELAGQFVESLLATISEPAALYEILRGMLAVWKTVGIHPRTGVFCEVLARLRFDWLPKLMDNVIADASGQGDLLAGSLLLQLTKQGETKAIDDWVSSIVSVITPDRTELGSAVWTHLKVFRRTEPFSDDELDVILALLRKGSIALNREFLDLLGSASIYLNREKLARIIADSLSERKSNELFTASAEMLNRWQHWARPGQLPVSGLRTLLRSWVHWRKMREDKIGAFLSWYSESDPEFVWSFYFDRLLRASEEGYDPLPWLSKMRFAGFHEWPGALERLPELLDRAETLSSEKWEVKNAWRNWFHLVARSCGERYVNWLTEDYESLSRTALEWACGVFSDGSSFVFDQPALVALLLKRAQELGAEAYAQVEGRLASSVELSGGWMEAGAKRERVLKLRARASEAAQRHRHDPLLYSFYHKLSICAGGVDLRKGEY